MSRPKPKVTYITVGKVQAPSRSVTKPGRRGLESGPQESANLGPINILVNFVGTVCCQHAMDVSPGDWRRTIDISMTGSFIVAQDVARTMAATKTGGSIVLVASISGHRVNWPQPQSAYNVSKAGVIMTKRCLAAEWAHHGIRVNSIIPGYMNTILNEGDGLEVARKI